MTTIFRISYNLTENWNFAIFLQILTYCNFPNFCLVKNIIRIISRDFLSRRNHKCNFLFFPKKISKIQKMFLSQFWSDVAGPFFLGHQEVCEISIQSDNSIEIYRVHTRRTDRHFRNNRFF